MTKKFLTDAATVLFRKVTPTLLAGALVFSCFGVISHDSVMAKAKKVKKTKAVNAITFLNAKVSGNSKSNTTVVTWNKVNKAVKVKVKGFGKKKARYKNLKPAYQYRLDDKAWMNTKKNSIKLKNLKDGKHKFSVRTVVTYKYKAKKNKKAVNKTKVLSTKMVFFNVKREKQEKPLKPLKPLKPIKPIDENIVEYKGKKYNIKDTNYIENETVKLSDDKTKIIVEWDAILNKNHDVFHYIYSEQTANGVLTPIAYKLETAGHYTATLDVKPSVKECEIVIVIQDKTTKVNQVKKLKIAV